MLLNSFSILAAIINIHLCHLIVETIKLRSFISASVLIVFLVVQVMALPSLEDINQDLIIQLTISTAFTVLLIPVYIWITELTHRFQGSTLDNLQNQSLAYKALLDSMKEGVMVLDQNLELKFMNLISDCVFGYLSFMKTGNRQTSSNLMDMMFFDVLTNPTTDTPENQSHPRK